MPGIGWSSPIVWGERIFLTAVVSAGKLEEARKGLYVGGERPAPQVEHRWMLYALDWKTGRILWEREAHRGLPAMSRHLKNSYASETPVTDGERVYTYFGNVGLFCYDLDGRLLWSQKWGPFKTRNGWGTAASPVLHRGRVYVVNDNDEQAFLIGLDARTGKTLWRVDRDAETNWATPFVWEHAARTEIVTSATRRVRSYDLSGKPLWELAGMSTIVIPTPFSRHRLLYVASGYVGDQLRPVYAIRPGASGDDRGFFTCHDAKTGKEIYGKQRIDPAAGAFTASPWAYNGKIFALSEDGDTYVIQAGPEYRLLGKNSLGEFSMASPAIVRDSLILRTASHVYRISERGN